MSTPEEFGRRLLEAATEEAAAPEALWWLSFADAELAEGDQFLGVAIVRAHGIVGAAAVTHRLGINPGGGEQQT